MDIMSKHCLYKKLILTEGYEWSVDQTISYKDRLTILHLYITIGIFLI